MKKIITTVGIIASTLLVNAQVRSVRPIASYLFSNNTVDATENLNNATIVSSTAPSGIQYIKDRFGNTNSALLFNGEDGYLDCGNPSIYSNLSGLTISLWIKDTLAVPIKKDECLKCEVIGGGEIITPKKNNLRSASYQHILSKGYWNDGTQTAFAFCMNGNQPYGLLNIYQPIIKEEILKRTEGTSFSEVFANSASFDIISDKNWHQLVMTWSNTGVAKFYLNGALVQTIQNITTNINNTSVAKLFIGKSFHAGYNFAGALDDIMIYNITKTDTDVLTDFNSAKPTGIENDQFGNKMSLAYPNPTKDILHVSGSAEIFDLIGNKVASGSNEINVEHLLSGIYVVKANGKSQKIVKE